MPDTPEEPIDPVTASTPPVGVSSLQIFAIALMLLAFYGVQLVAAIWWGSEAERSSFSQSTINLALLAAGYFLGSSASSRNKDHGR